MIIIQTRKNYTLFNILIMLARSRVLASSDSPKHKFRNSHFGTLKQHDFEKKIFKSDLSSLKETLMISKAWETSTNSISNVEPRLSLSFSLAALKLQSNLIIAPFCMLRTSSK